MAKKFTKLFLGDIVHTVGSKVFRKLSTEEPQDETIVGTWLFNEYIAFNGGAWYSVNFTSNGVSYIAFSDRRSQTSAIHDMSLRYFKTSTTYDIAFGGDGSWRNEAYRTITIIEEPTDEEFITWLKANATKQGASTPTLITFTIIGTTYQAEEGMTWGEWCNSDYNTDNYGINSDGSISPDGGYLGGWVDYSDSLVNSVDVIVPDRAYNIKPYSSGGSND